MPDSIINCQNSITADVVLIGANYDRTSSGQKGADQGPSAIKQCLDTQIEFYEPITGTVPRARQKIAFADHTDLHQLTPEKMVDVVSLHYGMLSVRRKRPFLILIGGEHSVTNGALKAIALRRSTKQITVLQIDAHFDLRNDDSDFNDEPWGKFAHCSVMRRAVELGFKLVPVGVRAYSEEELMFAKKNGIKFFSWDKMKIPSVESIIRAIKTRDVYLTIDVDGIDPSHMPATGTPVPNGLSWIYTIQLLKQLFAKKNVIAADVAEVAPPLELNSLTVIGAAQLIYTIIALKFLK